MEPPKLKVGDLQFSVFIPSESPEEWREARDFIVKYDWLKSVTQGISHCFKATYKGHLAGVVMMACPTQFSNLLGKHRRDMERLICRGACISWSPKNLASSLVMHAVKWMVKNTHYRLFTAYADPKAGELGTIYQACNFYYLGSRYGASDLYTNPLDPEKRKRSSRWFKRFSVYKSYAKYLGYEWNDEWNTKTVIHWEKMPQDIVTELKEMATLQRLMSIREPIPLKHKYCLVLGKDRYETKKLNYFFLLNNKDIVADYPKVRGVWKT